MREIVTVTDDSTREELATAIGHLRAKAMSETDEVRAAEWQAECDRLLEAWAVARS